MTAQLAFDALPEWRTRDGIWPIDAHQRGWVRLPERLIGKIGDRDNPPADPRFVPGWVCCRCGGVELGEHVLVINHSCCFTPWRSLHKTVRPCSWQETTERMRRLGGGRKLPEPGPFWSLWTPERPP